MPISDNLYTENGFEVVIDQVIAIILIEVLQQKTIAISEGNTDYLNILNSFYDTKNGVESLNLWKNRFTRYDISELNAINVRFAQEVLGKGSQAKQQKAGLRLFVELHVKKKGDLNEKGDVEASRYLLKMLGVIRSIIMHTTYITLGIQTAFISRRWVSFVEMDQPQDVINSTNSDNAITGSIALDVDFDEKNLPVVAVELNENHTRITGNNGEYRLDNDNL